MWVPVASANAASYLRAPMSVQYRRTTPTAPAGSAPLVICGLGTAVGPVAAGDDGSGDAVGEVPPAEPPQATRRVAAPQAMMTAMTDGRLMVPTKAPFVACALC